MKRASISALAAARSHLVPKVGQRSNLVTPLPGIHHFLPSFSNFSSLRSPSQLKSNVQWPETSQVVALHSSAAARQESASTEWGDKGSQTCMVPEKEGDSVWALGMRVTVKTKVEDTNGAYSTMEYHLSPGDGCDEHLHGNEDETWFLLDGTMKWKFEDLVYEAKKGDFVHMPRGKRHSFQNVSDKEAHMLVHCIPGGLEKYFLEIGKPVDPNPRAKKPATTQEVAKTASKIAKKYGLTYFQAVESLRDSSCSENSKNSHKSQNFESQQSQPQKHGNEKEHSPASGPTPESVMEKSKTEKGYQ